jgi:hypothetical protein
VISASGYKYKDVMRKIGVVDFPSLDCPPIHLLLLLLFIKYRLIDPKILVALLTIPKTSLEETAIQFPNCGSLVVEKFLVEASLLPLSIL